MHIDDIKALKVVELRNHLSLNGLPTQGKKDELIERLSLFYQYFFNEMRLKNRQKEETTGQVEEPVDFEDVDAMLGDVDATFGLQEEDKEKVNEEQIEKEEKETEKKRD